MSQVCLQATKSCTKSHSAAGLDWVPSIQTRQRHVSNPEPLLHWIALTVSSLWSNFIGPVSMRDIGVGLHLVFKVNMSKTTPSCQRLCGYFWPLAHLDPSFAPHAALLCRHYLSMFTLTLPAFQIFSHYVQCTPPPNLKMHTTTMNHVDLDLTVHAWWWLYKFLTTGQNNSW